MTISKKQWIFALASIAIIAVAIGVLGRSAPKTEESAGSAIEQATSTEAVASSTESGAKAAVTNVGPFPINAKDAIASWTFKGQYAGSDILMKQANDDIAHLNGLLGSGKYDDYDVYNGLGNDYTMIGEGKLAYQNYNRSIAIHPKKGLAFVNLAHLMQGLGAKYTAADAYAAAVTAEPGQLEYHVERLTYLTEQFPKDAAMITAALADVSKQFGDNASILSIEAQWLTAEKRYADAIKAWQTAKQIMPGKDTTSIDAAIARLQAKL